MIAKPVLDAVRLVVESFEQIGIKYVIGGSVASAFYGMDRTTVDVDIAVDLRLEQVTQFVNQLQDKYYVDADMVRDAIQHRSSCNLIYLQNWTKIDLFVTKGLEFDSLEFQRARCDTFIIDRDTVTLCVASPEDVILRKLKWYKDGGETSERQWLDVLGVLKIQSDRLDREYMTQWAADLGISDLLERALEDAGLPPMEDIEF
jgi:hypothetical protein